MTETRPSVAQRVSHRLGAVNWHSTPVVVASVITALAVIVGVVVNAIRVVETPKRLDVHIAAESLWHAQWMERAERADSHDEDQHRMIEAMVRGECLENPRENLARQGLLPTCQRLGIQP